ncbi:hypothetical protein [Microbacterium sp. 18062]|uniref:hypothetical protein n=1 Tax=Microbacterium sp. 18062 TaxID=2681410 RepID=UPI00135A38BF|nr:hypothetical protein [Microbacterium sp. 18062]
MRAWCNTAYLVAIADANDADWLQLDTELDSTGWLGSGRPAERTRLSVPPRIAALARNGAAPLFGTIRFLTADRRARR